ncbi:class I SAM-dependent methyltransferase [Halarchaeum sp. P4]|uniref:class I SAM-dependent methyltransferase n=1 Tax=Halarchaeum sp. P4 TaxID=3421639 RepID=UPI003EB98092
MSTQAARTLAFYDRWARCYDVLARNAPGVSRVRDAAADALALDAGDTAVEMGCGSGANLARLRERVGSTGRVVGVDAVPGMLARARRTGVDAALVRADATNPPVAAPVDAVLASFVVGVLDDPARAVEAWCDLLESGGRLVLLEATTSTAPVGRLANPLFRAFVRTGAPGTPAGAADALDSAVADAHAAARERATNCRETRLFGGFCSVFVAEV